jgi:hypothetical protein
LSFHRNLTGSDLHSPSNHTVENQTGLTILKHKVVRLDGFGSAFPKIALADPASYAVFGITQADFPNSSVANITCLGLIYSVDTSAWLPGTSLYSDTSGNLVTSPILGKPVATVVKQNATSGILYVVAATDVFAGGSSGFWKVDGNLGTSPISNYIGTSDSQPLLIKTNAIEALRVTTQQRLGIGTPTPGLHVEQKSHTSTNASGIQIETYYVETNSNLPQVAYSLNIANPETVRFTFEATARAIDGSGRALFIRTGLAYRESSNVQLQGGTWEADNTIKSDNAYSVSYQLGVSSIIFRVKSAVSSETHWTGRITVQRVI